MVFSTVIDILVALLILEMSEFRASDAETVSEFKTGNGFSYVWLSMGDETEEDNDKTKEKEVKDVKT